VNAKEKAILTVREEHRYVYAILYLEMITEAEGNLNAKCSEPMVGS
jgi:hypothetical protein